MTDNKIAFKDCVQLWCRNCGTLHDLEDNAKDLSPIHFQED